MIYMIKYLEEGLIDNIEKDVIYVLFSIINKREDLAMLSIFFIQPIFILGLMELFNGSKIFKSYFEYRAQRTKDNDRGIIQRNELLALMTIFIQASFFRNLTWYNIIIVIVLGIVFEYLRDLVKVELNNN